MTDKKLHIKGSEWKKWDLHIHTPYSGEYGDDNNNDNDDQIWDKFIEELEGSDLDCIGINDYCIIDGYERVLEYQKNGRLKGKKIFPVIEYRIDKFSLKNENKWSKINLHIIINPEKDCAWIAKKIIQAINVDYTNGEQKQNIKEFFNDKDDMKAYTIKYSNVEEKILNNVELRKDILIGLGYNEWDNLCWNKDKDIKQNFIKDMDFLLCASEKEKIEKRWSNLVAKAELKNLNRNFMLINASDKHGFKDKTGHCNDFSKFSYIKTDCFEGLRVLANEKSRIAYSECGTNINNINTVIESIKFNDDIIKKDKLGVTTNSNEDFILSFNKELVAIIGNKGAGKSLLGWMLYLAFKPEFEKNEYKEILNYENKDKDAGKDRYNKIISVKNGSTTLANIRYFSQNYINNLMDYDLEKNTESKLEEFLKEVMDEYKNNENEEVDNSEDYEKKIKELNEYITKNDLDTIKESIQDQENGIKVETDNIKTISKKINQYNSDENQKEYNKRFEELNKLKGEQEKLNKNLKILEDTQKEIFNLWEIFKSNLNDKLTKFIGILKPSDDKENKEILEHRENLSLIFDGKLIKILESAIEKKKGENDNKNKEIEDKTTSLQDFKVKNEIKSEAEIQDLQNKITEIQGNINKYEEEKKRLETTKIEYEEKKKKHEECFIGYLESKKNEKNKIMLGIVDQFNSYKKEVIDKITEEMKEEDNVGDLIEELQKITIKVVDEKNDKYKEGLDDCLKYSDSFIAKIVSSRDKFFDSDGSDNSSFDKIYSEIWKEINEIGIKKIEMGKVLKSNKNTLDLMNSIFLFNINFKYNLNYDGKDFNKLSGGQKGTALTLVILMFDKKYNDKILIIDQPEDQLDNKTVNTILVPAFKFAKKKRQIFLITHNANLVINADAEQIIVAKDDKKDKKVSLKYKAGSLEDEEIKGDICKILEGGEEAFEKRRLKYNIK